MIDYSFPTQELEYFLLILTRITCFIYIAPFFGMNNTPNRVKIALAVFVSYLLYHSTLPYADIPYETVLQYAVIVIKEAIAGLLIGFGAYICTSITLFAGRIADMEMGMSMASLMDPTTKENSTITGLLYQYGFMLMMLISGMHRYLLLALKESYTLIPVGGVHIQLDAMLTTFLGFLSDYMLIGFRICFPVFATIMLLNAVLGILAKVAPQMNMFAVGLQLKILTGFTALFLTIGFMPTISSFIFEQVKRMVTSFVEGMM